MFLREPIFPEPQPCHSLLYNELNLSLARRVLISATETEYTSTPFFLNIRTLLHDS